MIRAEGNCLLEYKSQMEELAGSVGSGLVSLHKKVMPPSASLLSLRIAYYRKCSLLSGSKAPENKKRYLKHVFRGGRIAGVRSLSSKRRQVGLS